MTRLTWTYRGMGSIGDTEGPLDIATATYQDRLITRYTSRTHPTRGAHYHLADGAHFRRLVDIQAEIDARLGGPQTPGTETV